MSERRTPDLPKSATTTGDMGMSMFDMRSLNDLLVKGNLPAIKRSIYMNMISLALGFKRKGLPKLAKLYYVRTSTDLRAMVGEKHARINQFQLAFENELHHEKRKNEEKPQI